VGACFIIELTFLGAAARSSRLDKHALIALTNKRHVRVIS